MGFFKAVVGPNGVMAVLDQVFQAPVEHKGQNLRMEDDNDAATDWSPQFEGLVIDRTTGTVYAGQEDVGIWSFSAARSACPRRTGALPRPQATGLADDIGHRPAVAA